MALAPNTAQPDNSMVPPVARRAAEEANRRIEAEAAARRGEAPPAPAPAPTNPEPPPANPHPEPSPGPTPEPRPEPTNPAPDRTAEDEAARHAERSAEGRLAKARQELATANEEITNLRRLLSVMQTAPAAPAPSSEMMFQAEDLTPEEREQWGDDFVMVVDKRAKALIAPLERQLRDALAQVQGRVEQQVEHTQLSERQRMLNTLDTNDKIRGWREINREPEFVEWLAVIDRRAGQQRHLMIKDAFEANDASRVAAFFEDYLQETGQVPAPRTAAEPAPVAAQPAKVSLESLAAPGKAGRSGDAPRAPAAPEPVSRRDIARFYADLRAGKFRGREDDAKAFEASIFEATRTGNIVD